MSLTTLANLKVWLGTTTTTDDALMQRLIDAASAFIESWLNRKILQATYNEIYDGTGTDTLTTQTYPITSLLSCSFSGTAQKILSAGDFSSAAIDFTDSQLYGQFLTFPLGRQNISISYVAGYVTVPLDVEQACIELCSFRYKNLRNDRLGLTSKGLAGESTSFFVGDMLPTTKAILNQYRNVVPV